VVALQQVDMEGTGSSVGGMSSGSVDLDPGVDITHLEGRLASCDREERPEELMCFFQNVFFDAWQRHHHFRQTTRGGGSYTVARMWTTPGGGLTDHLIPSVIACVSYEDMAALYTFITRHGKFLKSQGATTRNSLVALMKWLVDDVMQNCEKAARKIENLALGRNDFHGARYIRQTQLVFVSIICGKLRWACGHYGIGLVQFCDTHDKQRFVTHPQNNIETYLFDTDKAAGNAQKAMFDEIFDGSWDPGEDLDRESRERAAFPAASTA